MTNLTRCSTRRIFIGFNVVRHMATTRQTRHLHTVSSAITRGEGMLVAQAHTLDELFQRLTRQALGAEYMSNLETYLRLALKAQSNARATWEAISRLQNPSINYVKQANIAQNQQINVGNTTESEKQNPPSKLLEHEQHERLDTGTQATPIGADQELEAVGSVNRSANGRGKEQVVAE